MPAFPKKSILHLLILILLLPEIFIPLLFAPIISKLNMEINLFDDSNEIELSILDT